jgi:transglutaminase-like putative cysteine protease
VTVYRIRHASLYAYQVPVVHSHHRLRLTPHACFGQQLRRHEILVDSTVALQHQQLDAWGNAERHLELSAPYTSLGIIADSEVQVERQAADIAADTSAWDALPPLPAGIEAFRWNSPYVRRAADARSYVAASFPPGRALCAGLFDLVSRIQADYIYDPVATDIATPVERVLIERRGVCQDFAHLALAGLRSLGLAACYISGYLETVPPPGTRRLRGADASHAWIACWHPRLGWVMADPTNGCLVGDRHVVVAQGRDFADVSPIAGIIFGGGQQTLRVEVDVVPEREWAAFAW